MSPKRPPDIYLQDVPPERPDAALPVTRADYEAIYEDAFQVRAAAMVIGDSQRLGLAWDLRVVGEDLERLLERMMTALEAAQRPEGPHYRRSMGANANHAVRRGERQTLCGRPVDLQPQLGWDPTDGDSCGRCKAVARSEAHRLGSASPAGEEE